MAKDCTWDETFVIFEEFDERNWPEERVLDDHPENTKRKKKKKKLADFTLPLNSSGETIVHWLNNLSKLTIYSFTRIG